MSSVPCESGEDKRQNKRVRIYQPKAPESNPVAYLAPGGEWAEEESVGYLQPLFLEEPEFHRKDILQEMNLMSRLPEFMQVVFGVCRDTLRELILWHRIGKKKNLQKKQSV